MPRDHALGDTAKPHDPAARLLPVNGERQSKVVEGFGQIGHSEIFYNGTRIVIPALRRDPVQLTPLREALDPGARPG